MSERGVASFYYSRNLPERSVAIAEIEVPPLTPAQLTDVNNTVYSAGRLGVWRVTGSAPGPVPDFPAADLGVAVTFSGATSYFVGSQFFELTDRTAADGTTPLFYQHVVENVDPNRCHITVLDLAGAVQPGTFNLVSSGVNAVTVYHNMDGGPYRIQFINLQGLLVKQVLRYDRTIALSAIAASPRFYSLRGALLGVAGPGSYWIRFTATNGYQVMPMYTCLPNIPWYPRIRYGLRPPPVDWARQQFVGGPPYMPASFVAGKALDAHMIEFERTYVLDDGSHWPDILVFDRSNRFKYALDGFVGPTSSTGEIPYLKGTIYHWQRGQIGSIDFARARVDVSVDLDPTDIIWGFYTYAEPDVIYTDFDCNPFTNALAKNTILELYVKFSGGDPNRNIYHRLLDAEGAPIAGQTNDLAPLSGTNIVFAQVVVGASVSEVDFSLRDARVRGGGLAPEYQSIPQAVNFWDIGYWDGKPYPVGGALAIYLPRAILDLMGRADIEGRVNACLPMGALACVRYIDPAGNESM